ncbi:MAG: hypothetical protein U0746_07685 [Gemmataceae bacterium]
MIAVAFALAIWTTADLQWPCESDFYRDMGAAQSILDGRVGTDPAYLGELGWYNPLQPVIVAGLSKVTGVSLHVLYARVGPYLNLLGPIGFYILTRRLVGAWPAMASLGAYLFVVNPSAPSWFQATYSPWAWPMNVTQGLCYLTLAAYDVAAETRSLWWNLLTGVLLGLTFLGHAAPALLIVGMLTLATAFAPRGARLVALRRYILLGAISLVVASPFLLPLVARYRLHVLNPLPSEQSNFGLLYVARSLLGARTAFAAIGLVAVYRSADSKARSATLSLVASSALLLAYNMTAQVLRDRGVARWPQAVPAYHFLLYWKAIEALLFGVGATTVARWLTNRTALVRNEQLALVAMTALIVALHLPGYLRGRELATFRADSLATNAEHDRIALYDWLLAETRPDDVFLADLLTAFTTVAAADRKVVCIHDQSSSPYVSYDERLADTQALYESLRTNDEAAFLRRASKYRLRFVVLADDTRYDWSRVPLERLGPPQVDMVFSAGRYRVYRLK